MTHAHTQWVVNHGRRGEPITITKPGHPEVLATLPNATLEDLDRARLIAAAPSLLAALEWSLRVHSDILKRESEPWTDAARAILARVTA